MILPLFAQIYKPKLGGQETGGSGLDMRHLDIKEIPIWHVKEYS